MEQEARRQLAEFAARYTPDIEEQIHAAHAIMSSMLPGALEIVYDNYNALVIGFGASDRMADFVFSIAAYPRYLTLFFAHGVDLENTKGLLQGEGSMVRSIRLNSPEQLHDPDIQELMTAALERATPIDASNPNRLIIKSVSAKQRPRRPKG